MNFILQFFKNFVFFLFLCLINMQVLGQGSKIENARQKFLEGEYSEAINIASKIESIEAKVFQARVMSIYGHFFFGKR